MVIQVKVKNIYGKDLFYPVNYITELQNLTGKKTLLPSHIESLKKLGFTFEVVTKQAIL